MRKHLALAAALAASAALHAQDTGGPVFGFKSSVVFPTSLDGGHLKNSVGSGWGLGAFLESHINAKNAARYSVEYIKFSEKEIEVAFASVRADADILGFKTDWLHRAVSHREGFYTLLGCGVSRASQEAWTRSSKVSLNTTGFELSAGVGVNFGLLGIEAKFTQSLWWTFKSGGESKAEDWGHFHIGATFRF